MDLLLLEFHDSHCLLLKTVLSFENMKHLFWAFSSSFINLSLFPVSLGSVSVRVCTGLWASVRVGHRRVLPGQIQARHAGAGSETLVFLGGHS